MSEGAGKCKTYEPQVPWTMQDRGYNGVVFGVVSCWDWVDIGKCRGGHGDKSFPGKKRDVSVGWPGQD